MKKIISLIGLIFCANALEIDSGWQLKGSISNIEVNNTFNTSKIGAVWGYENGKWKVYFPNNNELMEKIKRGEFPNIEPLNKLKSEEGFWVLANDNTQIENNNIVESVLKDGIKGFENKTFYVSYIEDFWPDDRDVWKADIKDNNLTIITSYEKFSLKVYLNKYSLVSIHDDESSVDHLLKTDIKNNLVFLWDESGISIVSSSKEAIENYVNNLKNEFPREEIDPKTLKGKYLYGLGDDKFEWYALKLDDEKITMYNMDDIFELDDEDNYKYPWTYNIEYLDNNKIKIYENEDEETCKVYKYDLSNKNIDVYLLGSALDSNRVFPQKWINFGIDSLKFTKGNAYCNLAWNECWFDADAIKEMNSNMLNVNDIYAMKKGEAKPPRYSKITDYLNSQPYYSVYTEYSFIDYEKDYISDDKLCYSEIKNNSDNLDSGCGLSFDEANDYFRVIAEYDNGIEVEVNYNGEHYKTFLYDNEADAKKAYQILLSRYE